MLLCRTNQFRWHGWHAARRGLGSNLYVCSVIESGVLSKGFSHPSSSGRRYLLAGRVRPLPARVYVCLMVGKAEISNIRAMLTGIRLQIELLQKAVEQNPHDKESRKRLREAKTQGNVVLAKLREWTFH